MGVKGLWKLLDGTGHPVGLESLEGKVLAVDISVWLNMAVKGMRDYHGHSSQTAHLVSLFNRICKLLYHGIKPIFVFDGQAPALKQRTLRERRQRKNENVREGQKAGEKILQNFLKKQLLEEMTGGATGKRKTSGPKKKSESSKESTANKTKTQEEDIYNLPPLSANLRNSDDSELEEELSMRVELQREFHDNVTGNEFANILGMNIDSSDFNSLPSDVQYELLQDLREVRKRQRTRIEVMPEESDSFSNYQIKGLLAKRKITKKMESVENKMSHEHVASSSTLFGMNSDSMAGHSVVAKQLVSDSKSHFIWMRKLSNPTKPDTEMSQNSMTDSTPCTSQVQDEKAFGKKYSSLESDKEAQSNALVADSIPDASRMKDEIPDPNENFEHSRSVERIPSEGLTNHGTQITGTEACFPTEGHDNVSGPSKSSESDSDLEILEMGNINGSNLQRSNVHRSTSIVTIDSGNEMPKSNESFLSITKTAFDDNQHKLSAGASTSVTDGLPTVSEPSINDKNVSTHEKLVVRPQNRDNDRNSVQEKIVNLTSKDTPSLNNTKDYTKQIEIIDKSLEIGVEDKQQNPFNLENPLSDKNESSDDDFVDVPEEELEVKEIPTVSDTTPLDEDKRSLSKPVEEVIEENPWDGLDVADVSKFSEEIDEQSKELRKMMQARERAAREVSQSAQAECQDLLKLFGLPYIVSPQEAEAQCATLERIGLTDGTITDDSDVWLFGGKYVIKDMFGSRKDPVAFNASDIETQLGLNRDRLICLALCSGSDYTTGIYGIGPVTAMEILREFEGDGIEGLRKLKQWWKETVTTTTPVIPTETKIKSQLRRINLHKEFPSEVVYRAYMNPVVNSDKKKFDWGFPDLDELRVFATEVIGWTRQKVDEVLLPVIKRQGQRRSAQARITNYFQPALLQAGKKRSKRVQRAAAVLTGKQVPAKPGKSKRSKPSIKAREVLPRKNEEPELNLSEDSSDGE